MSREIGGDLGDARYSFVDQRFLPRNFVKNLGSVEIIERALEELEGRAILSANFRSGYYPHVPEADNFGLDNSRRVETAYPTVLEAGLQLPFDFIEVSLDDEPLPKELHLACPSSGVPDPDVLVWRASLNLGYETRVMSYSLERPNESALLTEGNIRICDQYTPELIVQAYVPGRIRHMVSGVFYCASEVMHTGEALGNELQGHQLLSYSIEEPR